MRGKIPPVQAAEGVSPMYRFAMAATAPVIRAWGRLEVEGLEHLPTSGPVLLAGNHDSYWDPLAIGSAGLPRNQICALAKSTLWNIPVLGKILNGMGQIPIDRGKGDLHALDLAVEALRDGRCIGVFIEGSTSKGRRLRARSGFGRLAESVPESEIVLATVEDCKVISRFPRRPSIRVRFFRPEGGGLQPGESPKEFSVRLLAELRSHAPHAPGTRRELKKYGGKAN
jgi:1-acyl-sn-glycerol-3-phosphate acyltransferase